MKKLNIQDFNKILVNEMLEKQKDKHPPKKHKEKEPKKKDVQLKPQTSNYNIGDIISGELILMKIDSGNKYTVDNIDYKNKKIVAYAADVDENGEVKLDPITRMPKMLPFTIDFKDVSDYVVA